MSHQTIWKFSFRLASEVVLKIPKGARILRAGQCLNSGDFCVWALVYPDSPTVNRRLRIYPTGAPLEPNEQAENYVDTIQTMTERGQLPLLAGLASLVWHVFDRGEVS